MTETFTAKGPDRTYSVGVFRVGRYGWRRWDATIHGWGSTARTPWTAMFRAWRFRRREARRMAAWHNRPVDPARMERARRALNAKREAS